MKIRRITANVYELPLGMVNAFIVEDDALTLIDTGAPGSTGKILAAVREIGRAPEDIQHILLTHAHPDHAGSVAELKRATPAKVWMHAAEAPHLAEGFIPKPPEPVFTSFLNKTLYNLFVKKASSEIPPANADELMEDGDWLPMAGGMHVIHIPGHSPGQLAFFLPGQKNVMFAADAADNMFGLSYACFYENLVEARHSLERLATFDFDIACFGHGRSILSNAAARFRKRFIHPAAHTAKDQQQWIAVEKEAIVRLQEPGEKL
ncbi:MBL fold metallo-hydrolase [Chitinophaga lutea]|uniref:MBL fold metallo-hydrolase n=1 Tax=Chitinophaga lutea TaxID=2488634 RepID=A0A3N4PCA4_9BACT|nr:MBL fold metallo-hydrolase [Chitinophaga lutea]RPE05856.1 MBL fold metallo-hydrolase [Chitinophaga lutea]